VRVATPAGDLDLGRAPGSAAGPDLKQLVLGSEGAFGVVTEVTVRVRPVPRRAARGWRIADLATGVDVLRTLAQRGPKPDLARLSDEVETAMASRPAAARGPGRRVHGAARLEGFATTSSGARAARRGAARRGGRAPRRGRGDAWRHGRFRAPRLRDELLAPGC